MTTLEAKRRVIFRHVSMDCSEWVSSWYHRRGMIRRVEFAYSTLVHCNTFKYKSRAEKRYKSSRLRRSKRIGVYVVPICIKAWSRSTELRQTDRRHQKFCRLASLRVREWRFGNRSSRCRRKAARADWLMADSTAPAPLRPTDTRQGSTEKKEDRVPGGWCCQTNTDAVALLLFTQASWLFLFLLSRTSENCNTL